MSFGERLRAARKNKGITLRELGVLVGEKTGSVLAESTIHGYEKGKREPQELEIVTAMSEILGVSTNQLLGKSQENLSLQQLLEMIEKDEVTLDGQDLSEFEKQHLRLFIRGMLKDRVPNAND